MSLHLDYYFTPQSPWTYLGHARFAALVERYNLIVTIKPADFGPVFAASGGLSLAKRSSQRQAYRLLELDRFRKSLNIAMNLQPKFFPADMTAASLLILAAREAVSADAALRLAGAIGRGMWADEANVADADTLLAITHQCSLDAPMLMTRSQTPEIAALYEACTQDAVATQVFGAPTYILEGEAFWGQDRLDFLERAIADRHPLS